MERLWTPWRMAYVTGDSSSETTSDRSRIFLDALASADDPDSLVVARGAHAFVIMNLFPYNSGHMMVVPNRRVSLLNQLNADERAELMELTTETTDVANSVLRCDGFNIGLNLGSVAGAGIAEHLHMHIVPRWLGDANFMPVTANTMVLPELLPATAARVKAEFAARTAQRDDRSTHSLAGALVFLPDEGLFVLRKADDGTIVIPKGHIESGESAAEAAIREVHEETGFQATITNWAGIERYERLGRNFHAVHFIAIGKRTAESSAHIGDDVVLVGPGDIERQLSYETSALLAKRALGILDLLSEEA